MKPYSDFARSQPEDFIKSAGMLVDLALSTDNKDALRKLLEAVLDASLSYTERRIKAYHEWLTAQLPDA